MNGSQGVLTSADGNGAAASELEHFDVLVVGAGLSGIDAAYRLQTSSPDRSFQILEAREEIGGTWDLFRYPGIRSDSDMITLGFPFRPWRGEKSIADGVAIRTYIADTAREFGIDRRIRFGHRVTAVSWSSTVSLWTVDVTLRDGSASRLTCNFLYMCSGYYDYAGGYTPAFPGIERFGGSVVHPQAWPQGLEVAGRRVVVIGSGATAVTLVPALVALGADVVMLQRSPTYVVSRPARDPAARRIRRFLPSTLADGVIRWKNILLGIATYRLSKSRPDKVKALIVDGVRQQLAPGYDVAKHFTPSYNPWDQRVCLVPDGDLFAALRSGNAKVVTDRIASFMEDGIELESGDILPADIVVSATGLVIQLVGGATVSVDGQKTALSEHMLYKGMMFSGVPNFAIAFGYTNASWTLKCDLTARYVCRLLNRMRRRGERICTPTLPAKGVEPEKMLDFTSGYVERAAKVLPRQGAKSPWRVHQNYVSDLLALSFGRLEDGVMRFERGPTSSLGPRA